MERNEFGQPMGAAVPHWEGAKPPAAAPIEGRRCRLEPLSTERHAASLHAAFAEDVSGTNWTYLTYGPFATAADYAEQVRSFETGSEGVFFAILEAETERPVGVASYLRIAPEQGSIEVGHLCYAPALQRTPASTEAMYLMMRRVFEDWGYRRYEWKCNALNAASRRAAERLGFRYEGTFRNALVAKGRNRDTAWLSITDEEWPAIRDALEAWLRDENFDAAGRQRQRLDAFMPETAGRALVTEREAGA